MVDLLTNAILYSYRFVPVLKHENVHTSIYSYMHMIPCTPTLTVRPHSPHTHPPHTHTHTLLTQVIRQASPHTMESSTLSSTIVPIVAGVVGGSVLLVGLLVAAVLLLCLVWRYRKKQEYGVGISCVEAKLHIPSVHLIIYVFI